MERKHGVRALSRLTGNMANVANKILVESIDDPDVDIRLSSLRALPVCAARVFDGLAIALDVRLEDDHEIVRKQAAETLRQLIRSHPSGAAETMKRALRSDSETMRKAAWAGLELLIQDWPEVFLEHADEILREEDPKPRRSLASLLVKIHGHRSGAAWDVIAWALEDEDAEVRGRVAPVIVRLANSAPDIALLLCERSINDDEPRVVSAISRALVRFDVTSPGRARALLMRACTHPNAGLRKTAIGSIGRAFGTEDGRLFAHELLSNEKEPEIVEMLLEIAKDREIEGDERERNLGLAPLDMPPAEEPEEPVGSDDHSGEFDQKRSLHDKFDTFKPTTRVEQKVDYEQRDPLRRQGEAVRRPMGRSDSKGHQSNQGSEVSTDNDATSASSSSPTKP